MLFSAVFATSAVNNMTLHVLNAFDDEDAAGELRRCCGSTRWVQMMTAARPFADAGAMAAAGDAIWASLAPADWLEAFASHPRIGETRAGEAGRAGRAGGSGAAREAGGSDGADWSQQEQAGVADAAGATRRRLAEANRQYEARFGYIFIVCATGRTAAGMLDLLEHRLRNEPGVELGVAAEEQRKIIRLRLAKLIGTEQVTTT
jgi:2-oxo-4-hydroxy-4-carboxy-5-ureidoimidazoline decarboxylase